MNLLEKMKLFVYTIINKKWLKGARVYGIPKVYFKNRVFLNKNVAINPNVFLHGAGGIKIGHQVVLSYGTAIISTGLDVTDWKNRIVGEERHIDKEIVIGDNVWLCANVTVLPGVKICNNIVVAAGAVVANDLVEENSLYAGVPAKLIKRLD